MDWNQRYANESDEDFKDFTNKFKFWTANHYLTRANEMMGLHDDMMDFHGKLAYDTTGGHPITRQQQVGAEKRGIDPITSPSHALAAHLHSAAFDAWSNLQGHMGILADDEHQSLHEDQCEALREHAEHLSSLANSVSEQFRHEDN